jgi:hypothetical protein
LLWLFWRWRSPDLFPHVGSNCDPPDLNF